MDELKERVKKIEERNKKVELDKKWETSIIRKIFICILTYLVVVTYNYFITNYNNIFLNSLVPVIGFFLSTLSINIIRKIWNKYQR